MYDLADVAGWGAYNNLHDLAHVSWVDSVLFCRSCTALAFFATVGEELDDLDHDLSVRGEN